jgi:hypothetical protein
MPVHRHHLLSAMQRRMDNCERILCAWSVAWVVIVGLALVSQMTPEDMENHRAETVRGEIRACHGAFEERYECTETILLTGERHGIVAVVERIGLTLLLPSVAWGVWWAVLRRIRGIYWLPKPMGRFRSFART